MWYRILFVSLLLATGSFVWFYRYPLAADMPMHMALAKAYADHLTGIADGESPYRPYLTVSSYELPELVLVPLILGFGLDTAWKIALSAYAVLFPLAIAFLVGRLNPESRWSRLVGFPLTLGYFFHWGFWPFLMGLLVAVAATAVSLGERSSARPRASEILTRLGTFLCHPVPAVCVGVFDAVRLGQGFLFQRGAGVAELLRTLGRWLWLWLPCVLLAFFMLGNDVDEGGFKWVSPLSQAKQLLRPFYLTRDWYEFALPLVFAGVLTFYLLKTSKLRAPQGFVLAAGIACVALGLLMPRKAFIGSWENGARVILYGFILIAACWSWLERPLKPLILGWVLVGSAINLVGSHRLWTLHEPPFAWAMDLLRREFSGYRVAGTGAWTGDNGIALGNNLPVWAWCEGIAVDAENLAGVRKTGPALYTGLPRPVRASVKTVIMHHHPYQRPARLLEPRPDRRLFFDAWEIYSLEERLPLERLSQSGGRGVE
ncbi:hypothetical protein [Candidatus Methylocalor cossyra]|uniref:Glycosyltransferase RgtA/B/C/D-like domain-containing protein n=1 Tax=Candidatus Methylocalor cossyra TaxID=3108543 RepID=A0ABM9NJK6_9GAMM